MIPPNVPVQAITRRPHWLVIGFEKEFMKYPSRVHTRSVHGKDFALFMNTNRSAVLIADDICPHRGASLSGGKVVDTDCIRCPYHGLHVGNMTTPKQMYDNAAIQGILWIDYDASKHSTTKHHHFLPPSAPEFSDIRFYTFEYSKTLRVNPILMTENTLDWQHLEHIHFFSLVKGIQPDVTIHETGPHGRASYSYVLTDNTLPYSEICVEVEYWVPLTTSLRFKLRDRKTGEASTAFYLWFSLTPSKNGEVTLHVRVSRTVFKQLPFVTDAIFSLINEIPLAEDASIVSKVSAAAWSSNLLTPADSFIEAYRKSMREHYPELLSWYVA
jgi:phenylpropionate dioxygenase-like ring-hydroxylating dioxygenase large terminal subunit